MKYMITWLERPQGSPIEYENAQKPLRRNLSDHNTMPAPASRPKITRAVGLGTIHPRSTAYFSAHDVPISSRTSPIRLNHCDPRRFSSESELPAVLNFGVACGTGFDGIREPSTDSATFVPGTATAAAATTVASGGGGGVSRKARCAVRASTLAALRPAIWLRRDATSSSSRATRASSPPLSPPSRPLASRGSNTSPMATTVPATAAPSPETS